MKFNIYILIIILISFCQCSRKSTNNTAPNYPLNPALKNTAFYEYYLGCFWVYTDSATGAKDSFYMDIPAFTSQFEALDLSYTYDTRVIQIYEQNTLNPLPRDSSVWYWYLSFDFISIKSISTNSKTPTLIYSPLLHYPFRDETNAPSDAVTLIPTYIVNGVTYHNVACAHFDSTSGSNVIANDYFYFADSTGIIQMNIDHPLDSINRVWKLNNYQIVQLKQ